MLLCCYVVMRLCDARIHVSTCVLCDVCTYVLWLCDARIHVMHICAAVMWCTYAHVYTYVWRMHVCAVVMLLCTYTRMCVVMLLCCYVLLLCAVVMYTSPAAILGYTNINICQAFTFGSRKIIYIVNYFSDGLDNTYLYSCRLNMRGRVFLLFMALSRYKYINP